MLPLARTCCALSLAAALLTSAANALASPNYPELLDRYSGVECPRPLTRCLICHVTAAGGEGSTKQPFGQLLMDEYGLEGKAGRSIAPTLDALPEDQDTDGDGTPDLEELATCANPSGENLSEGPGFGCNAELAATSEPGSAATGLAARISASLLLALALVRRRSRANAEARRPGASAR